ncbi:MAG: hypothetical protein ABSE64_00530 [Vulcanimicrobiaceae bacterium]
MAFLIPRRFQKRKELGLLPRLLGSIDRFRKLGRRGMTHADTRYIGRTTTRLRDAVGEMLEIVETHWRKLEFLEQWPPNEKHP